MFPFKLAKNENLEDYFPCDEYDTFSIKGNLYKVDKKSYEKKPLTIYQIIKKFNNINIEQLYDPSLKLIMNIFKLKTKREVLL